MVARDALNLLLRRVLPALAVAALLIASLKLAEDARFAPVPGVLSLCPPAAGSRNVASGTSWMRGRGSISCGQVVQSGSGSSANTRRRLAPHWPWIMSK